MARLAGTGAGGCRSGLADDLTNHQNILVAMQPLLNRSHSVLDRMLQGAFPDDSHAPAESKEQLCMAPVAIDISLEFPLPELLIGPGGGCVAAAFMSVPEAAMDEYHCPVLREHKVGGAGQRLHMKSIAKPSGEKKGAKRSLRPGVLSANARHHAAALRSGRDAHGLGYFPPRCLQKRQPRASTERSEWMKAVPEAAFGSLPCA